MFTDRRIDTGDELTALWCFGDRRRNKRSVLPVEVRPTAARAHGLRPTRNQRPERLVR
jgi:hypothetical protein